MSNSCNRDFTCQCPDPGPCPLLYNKEVRGRWYQYCRGTSGLPREDELRMLQLIGHDFGLAQRGEYRAVEDATLPTPGRHSVPCRHRGDPTGQRVACPTCAGNVEVKLFACALHTECTLQKRVDGVTACCAECNDYSPAEG